MIIPSLNKPGAGKKVVVAMSGGVDSSAAAALLKEQGYEVVGCFMRLGSPDEEETALGYDNMAEQEACDLTSDADGSSPQASGGKSHKQGCCSVNDAADARLVAAMLDVPFYVVNFKQDFGRIMDYFVREYNDGRTPNPCVRCNDWLKFGKLHAYAQSIDADYVATGHYARVDRRVKGRWVPAHETDPSAGEARLRRGVDLKKDQSYVLFGAAKAQLEHMLLPIGQFEKDVVRQIAEGHKLPTFNKPDSQEICFVPDQDYAALVKRRTPEGVIPGKIVDTDGTVLGEHPGHQHFTVGQRRGVNVDPTGPVTVPLYVLNRNANDNVITVGTKDQLLCTACDAAETNWHCGPPTDWIDCEVKARYNSHPTPGRVRSVPGEDLLEVEFTKPLDAVTPGQAIVAYDGDVVLGGGWIRNVTPAPAPASGSFGG